MAGTLVTQFDIDRNLDACEFAIAFAARFAGGRVELVADEIVPDHRRLHLTTRVEDRDAIFPWLDEYARTHDAISRKKPGDGFPFNPAV